MSEELKFGHAATETTSPTAKLPIKRVKSTPIAPVVAAKKAGAPLRGRAAALAAIEAKAGSKAKTTGEPKSPDGKTKSKTSDTGLCKNGCGRRVAEGKGKDGRAFDTCCRGCALGKEHDDACVKRAAASHGDVGMGHQPKAPTKATAKPGEVLHITVENIMQGDSLQVKLDAGKLVSDLKQEIERVRHELQASRHNILLDGVILPDSQTLRESGVVHGCTIACAPKLQEPARLGHGTKDERKSQIHEGWLQKRGALFGYKWQRVWCVLCPGRFLYYTDEKCWEKKGDITFGKKAALVPFSLPDAPGDAGKHAKDRPYGFVFDADPDAGSSRHLFYFDAEDRECLDAWVRAVRVASSDEEILRTCLAKFDQARASQTVVVSDGGLLAKHSVGWSSGWYQAISGAESHGIVYGDAPLQWFIEGAYFEVCVKETQTGSPSGLTIGITTAFPRLDQMPKSFPKVVSEVPRSWTLGYTGQATSNGTKEMKPIQWTPGDLKVGDRVGLLVNHKGEVWVLQNGDMIDCAPGKAPLSSNLYAVVALTGNTSAVALVPSAVPPASALLAQDHCDSAAGTLMAAASSLLASTGDNIGLAYKKLCGAGFAPADVDRCLQASSALRVSAATDIQKVARGAMARTQCFFTGLKMFFGGEECQTPIFQVECESGWIALDALVCLEIEAAIAKCLDSVEYKIDEKPYRADLNKMEQVNLSTKKCRKLRRSPGDRPIGTPSHWTVPLEEMPSQGWAIVPIHEKDPVFNVLQKSLKTDGTQLGIGADVKESGKFSSLVLRRAWRIENHNLWNLFQAGRQMVASEVRRKNVGQGNRNHVRGIVQDATCGLPGGLLQEVNEVRLLHGTKPETVLTLLQNGPNERFSGGLFGAGTYFAEDAGKTDQYVIRDSGFGTDPVMNELHSRLFPKGSGHPGNVFYVFLCRVVLGRFVRTKAGSTDALDVDNRQRVYATNERRELASIPGVSPPTHYHSLVGELGESIKRYREFVQFHQTRLYPEYLMAYQRQ